MKKYTKNILFTLTAVFLFLLAFNVSLAATLENPLGQSDPRIIIGNVIRALLGIVGSLALAVFIYGGFTWVISAGNDDKIKKGKDMIIWATFGLLVIFASYSLVTFIIGAIAGTSVGGGSEATGEISADGSIP